MAGRWAMTLGDDPWHLEASWRGAGVRCWSSLSLGLASTRSTSAYLNLHNAEDRRSLSQLIRTHIVAYVHISFKAVVDDTAMSYLRALVREILDARGWFSLHARSRKFERFHMPGCQVNSYWEASLWEPGLVGRRASGVTANLDASQGRSTSSPISPSHAFSAPPSSVTEPWAPSPQPLPLALDSPTDPGDIRPIGTTFNLVPHSSRLLIGHVLDLPGYHSFQWLGYWTSNIPIAVASIQHQHEHLQSLSVTVKDWATVWGAAVAAAFSNRPR